MHLLTSSVSSGLTVSEIPDGKLGRESHFQQDYSEVSTLRLSEAKRDRKRGKGTERRCLPAILCFDVRSRSSRLPDIPETRFEGVLRRVREHVPTQRLMAFGSKTEAMGLTQLTAVDVPSSAGPSSARMGWHNIAQGKPASGDALGFTAVSLQTESLRRISVSPSLSGWRTGIDDPGCRP